MSSDAAAATDLMFRPADELAGMVRSGELSARELVQASLDRIEELNPKLNAFVDVFADEALAAADDVSSGDERPLAGVPIAIKNNRAVEGKRLTFAAELFGDFAAPYDHNVVRRFKEAGAIIVGTTTLPEFGILPSTETARFGPTRNPWDTERTPGGSSGGSAAATASGMIPMGHGNDGGGSTRIPAACCGLVGLKPSRGRISMAPEIGEQFLTTDGVLTRTVRETAAMLDLLAGMEPGDASWAPPPAEPFAATAAREPERARVALATKSPIPGLELDPVRVAAVRDLGELLSSLGHDVEEVDPPWGEDTGLEETFTAVFGPMVMSQAKFGGLIAGREPAESDMEPLSWWLWERMSAMDSITGEVARMQLQAFARAAVVWSNQWDFVVTPALASAPVPIGTVSPMLPNGDGFRAAAAFTPFTAAYNITGQPAISLPLAESDGLPVGVQIAARPLGEGPLLALSAQVEAARPWAGRVPPVS